MTERYPILDELAQRGCFRVSIHPAVFSKTRIAYDQLSPIVEKCSVSLRGWDFPHISRRDDVRRGSDWIDQFTDSGYYREVWRFHQSGLFLFVAGYRWDWLEKDDGFLAPSSWPNRRIFSVIYAVYWFTEVFEFAARLAMSDAGGSRMVIRIELTDLSGRALWVEEPSRGSMDDFMADLDSHIYEEETSRESLVAEPRDMAVTAVIDLFQRFGWSPSSNLVKELQQGLRS